jgi:hypothetical protein
LVSGGDEGGWLDHMHGPMPEKESDSSQTGNSLVQKFSRVTANEGEARPEGSAINRKREIEPIRIKNALNYHRSWLFVSRWSKATKSQLR